MAWLARIEIKPKERQKKTIRLRIAFYGFDRLWVNFETLGVDYRDQLHAHNYHSNDIQNYPSNDLINTENYILNSNK